MIFFKKPDVDLEIAELEAELMSIDIIFNRATEVPAWLLDKRISVAGRLAKLRYKKEQNERVK